MRNSNYLWSVSVLLMTAPGTHGFVATLDGQQERGGNRYLWCPAPSIGGPWNSHTSHIYCRGWLPSWRRRSARARRIARWVGENGTYGCSVCSRHVSVI